MRKIVVFILFAVLASCSTSDRTKEVKEELKNYRKQVADLNSKIATLEKELKTSSNETEDYKVLVTVDTLTYREFHHFFEARGTVETINEAFISPEISGQIKKIYVKEGDRVKQGQFLVKLNTSVLENTIQEVEISLELATTVFNKQKQLWDKQIGSELQYLEAKNRKESLETRLKTLDSQIEMARIKSPIDGIVDDIFRKEGELASPGIMLMQIINLKDLYINTDVAENYLSKVKKGDLVSVSFPTYPELQLEVPVHRVGHVINPQNRTFIVQLKVNNRNDKLKPNILSIVTINDYSTNTALVVPSIILKQDMKGTYLYKAVDTDHGLIAKKDYITAGISYNDQTEVLEGLNPGDVVIINGYNLVSDGTEIKIK